jgi:hypothetical protein
MAQRQVSPGRKGVYYFGMLLAFAGLLSFFSVFFSVATRFGNPADVSVMGGSLIFRAVSGIIMIGVGRGLMQLGRVGLAGSGIVLDPEQARTDVEPWSRMAGGVVSDALDEAGLHLRDADSAELPVDEKLRRLHKLYEDGIVSEAQYESKKRDLLAKY